MFFVLKFLPKVILFHIWRLKCMYLYFLIVYKKYGAVVCKFFGFYGFANQTYMKWPLRESTFPPPNLVMCEENSTYTKQRHQQITFFHSMFPYFQTHALISKNAKQFEKRYPATPELFCINKSNCYWQMSRLVFDPKAVFKSGNFLRYD